MGKYAKATLEVEMESSSIQIVHPADQKPMAASSEHSVILSGANCLVGDERKRFREE
jgi:hypothetical protein